MSIFDGSSIVFDSITPDIIHIRVQEKKTLASVFYRFQEHYESPFPEIRGKIFTLGQLRSMGSRNKPGVNTYEGGHNFDSDWSGYNFPSYILDPFIKGLFDPLTEYEQDVVNTLRYKQGKFYVIGTFGENDPHGALDHEICHALYYVNEDYKKETDQVLDKYRDQLFGIIEMLKSWGYADTVIDDEIQAYMSADYDWFFENKTEDIEKYDIKIDKQLHFDLREIKDKHFKGDKK
jgi:hypothetical protein